MAQNFVACDRDQELLLPPSLREWLPDGISRGPSSTASSAFHLSAFYAVYRADGHGRPAHDPAMMVALVLYGYARGARSSRGIERALRRRRGDAGDRAQPPPDHATIARFVERHERALAGLFGDVLALCADAGLVRVGVVAVDGTKVAANASRDQTRGYEQIAREILDEAEAIDAEEDEGDGDARGDELPPRSRPRQGRRGWLREAQAPSRSSGAPRRRVRCRVIARPGSARRGVAWRKGTRTPSAARMTPTRPTGRAGVDERTAAGWLSAGSPHPPERPTGKINLTDPHSRPVKRIARWLQGYNAQAVATEDQIVIAAEVNRRLAGLRAPKSR